MITRYQPLYLSSSKPLEAQRILAASPRFPAFWGWKISDSEPQHCSGLATCPGPGIGMVMRQTRLPPPETEKGEMTPVQSLDIIPLNAEPRTSIFSWGVDAEAAWMLCASAGWVGGQGEQIQVPLITKPSSRFHSHM